MTTKKSMSGLGARFGPALVASMLLVACGGGGGDNQAKPADLTGADNTAEPIAAQDNFVDAVAAIIATTSDTADPVSIDSIPVTTPDNTAPVPVI